MLGREVPLNSKLEASSRQAKSKITARWKQAKSKPKTCEKQAKSKLKASCQRKVVTLAFAQDDNSVATHIRPYVRIRKKRSSSHSLYVRNGAMHVRQRTHIMRFFTLESYKSNCFDLCVRKHVWQARSKLRIISKKDKSKCTSELKASYQQARNKLKAS